jgi:arylsulfatase A-like enzyme
VFENFFSQASYTVPAHGSILTGMYPEVHGAGHESPEAPLREGLTTLAEALVAQRYRTLAFTAGGMVSEHLGFARGFDLWVQRTRAGLSSVLPEVIEAVQSADGDPFFLFLHTYDVHGPYPSAAVRAARSEAAAPSPTEEWKRLLTVPQLQYQQLDRFRGLDEVSLAYDEGIRSVDAQLGVFFDLLRREGLYDESLVIVTSDHGETLYERSRYLGHGFTLHDEELRVPLIVRLPGARAHGRRHGLVEQVDLMPLILAEVGAPPDSSLSGIDPFGRQQGSEKAFVRSETSHSGARSIRSTSWKVISPTNQAWRRKAARLAGVYGRFDTGWQIFDLEADPGERVNLFGRAEGLPDEIRALVRSLLASGQPGLGADATAHDSELAAELRALGYL